MATSIVDPAPGEFWHAQGLVKNIRTGEDILIISVTATEVIYEYQSDKKKSKKSLSSFKSQCVLGKYSTKKVGSSPSKGTPVAPTHGASIPKEYSVGSLWHSIKLPMKTDGRLVVIKGIVGLNIYYSYVDQVPADVQCRRFDQFKSCTKPLDAAEQAVAIVQSQAPAPVGCQHPVTKWCGDEEYCSICQETIRVITNNPYAVDPDLNKMVKHFNRY